MEYQGVFEEENDKYKSFVEKFKPKKTTDDCYTPEPVYNAVRDYVCARFGISPHRIVRPFWPGADYERAEYPAGCCVLDNPPFSILSKILSFYTGNGIRFFLFCPALTAFSFLKRTDISILNVGAQIVYENGALVPTSFVHNLGDPEIVAETSPELTKKITDICEELAKAKKKQVRKLRLPAEIITSSQMNWLSLHGVSFTIRRKSCLFIRNLDNMTGSIFGAGLMLSERAAVERAAVERAAGARSGRARSGRARSGRARSGRARSGRARSGSSTFWTRKRAN